MIRSKHYWIEGKLNTSFESTSLCRKVLSEQLKNSPYPENIHHSFITAFSEVTTSIIQQEQSQVKEISVKIIGDHKTVLMEISDDGRPLPPNEPMTKQTGTQIVTQRNTHRELAMKIIENLFNEYRYMSAHESIDGKNHLQLKMNLGS